MNQTISTFTDKGSREVNEDCVMRAQRGASSLFVLCDGLGGHGKGELASAFVCECLCSAFQSSHNDDAFFETALDTAQQGLLEEQKRLNATFEMKTTCVALVVGEDSFRYAYIGDSRLYHFRKNKVFLRTLDHSVPQMLALAGDIKERQIRSHPDRNRLLRVMGVSWDSPRYEVSRWLPLKSGDAFLLCSDGFWEPIVEKEMCRALKKTDDAPDWLELMQQTVRKNGEGTDMDNFSAIAVRIK